MERIGFGLRTVAMLIDIVLVLIVMGAASAVFGVSMFGGALADPDMFGGASVGVLSLAGIVISIIPLAYMSLEVFKAATPGKMVLGLKIRDANGSDADQATLVKRFVFKNSGSLLTMLAAITTFSLFSRIGNLAGLVVGIGCFFTLRSAKQAFHDMGAGTAVYKAGSK